MVVPFQDVKLCSEGKTQFSSSEHCQTYALAPGASATKRAVPPGATLQSAGWRVREVSKDREAAELAVEAPPGNRARQR